MNWKSVKVFLKPEWKKIILTLIFVIFEISILLVGYEYLFCFESQRPIGHVTASHCSWTTWVRVFLLDVEPGKGGFLFLTPSTFTKIRK